MHHAPLRSSFRAASALAAAMLAGLACSPGAAATAYTCSANTTSNNGVTEIQLGGTLSGAAPCINSAGSPDSDPLGHRVQASSQAEPGRLRGMSSVAGAPPADRGLILGSSSSSFFSESGILVGGLPEGGAQLDFRVRLHGTLDSDTTDVPFPFNTAVTASDLFRANLTNEVTGASVSPLLESCVNNPDSSVSTCNIPGGPAGRSTEVIVIVPLSVFARNGDTLFVSLLLNTNAFGFTPRGNFVQARADFNNTVDWLGVVAGAAPPGLTLTAPSGFDYALGIDPSPVPEPAAWAMWILGLALTRAAARRR